MLLSIVDVRYVAIFERQRVNAQRQTVSGGMRRRVSPLGSLATSSCVAAAESAVSDENIVAVGGVDLVGLVRHLLEPQRAELVGPDDEARTPLAPRGRRSDQVADARV